MIIRAVLARLTPLLLGCAVGLAMLEGALRSFDVDARLMGSSLFYLTGGNAAEHRASADPFLHYELNPNAHMEGQSPTGHPFTVNIDAFGARLPTHPARKSSGVFRILCFGGSTLFGANVEDDETIPAAMERQLDRRGRRFEVWNFGTSAYNLAQATHLARRKLAPLDPDLIVVQLLNRFQRPFYLPFGTDPAELVRTFERSDPFFVPEQFPAPPWLPDAPHRFAMRHLAVYRAMMGVYRRFARPSIRFSDRLGAHRARGLVRRAAGRGIPVVFVAVPALRGGLGPDSAVYRGLPATRFIDLNQPGREPDFYEAHPPPAILDEYASRIVAELAARGLLPRAGAS